MKIIAFPYAYGSASIYHELKNELKDYCDFYAFDYPAHGSRLDEPPICSITKIVDDLFKQIRKLISEPYCLLGYSIGGIVAFELYKKLKNEGENLPCHIFLLGSREPSWKYENDHYENFDLTGVKNILRNRNGTSEEILAEDELIQLLAPGIIADSIAMRDYYCDKNSSVSVDCEVTVVRGSQESNTEKCHQKWEEYLKTNIRYIIVEGNHFFLFNGSKNRVKEIRDIIISQLNSKG